MHATWFVVSVYFWLEIETSAMGVESIERVEQNGIVSCKARSWGFSMPAFLSHGCSHQFSSRHVPDYR